MAESVDGRSGAKKKKRKRVGVVMEGVPEAADRIAPVVGYFPSGYDPQGSSSAEPSIKAFRNKKRPNRLELVVSPSDSGVEFVGKSYAGEAAAAQICSYALGVLDKESQTLKIVPIASNKILRLEPRLKVNPFAETEASEVLAESIGTNKVDRKMADLTSLYGTKKDKDRDNKWKSLDQQRTDQEHLESINLVVDGENEVLEDTVQSVERNIPPYDPSANTPEKAYRLEEIILKIERDHLFDILEVLHSEADFSSKNYPSFVFNRIPKLKVLKDEKEQEKLASILSYICHLHNFWERMHVSRHSKYASPGKSTDRHIPRIVYQKLTRTFLDTQTGVLSTEKNELLIGYILVLTLFVDSFQTDPTDIARDLQMTVQSLKPYFQQLGCKGFKENPFKPTLMILNAPLKFPELRRARRRR
ncbi:hypothetical protein Cni_G01980 [Canna indica]|uniref:DNA-directed RNA polymerase I subunit rpa49 n=1 Tax=Canna indica TaxID=4628 RepID=A0AAQ3PZ44_9LILI|nr:hypothetical protein Cni_G01980 [Canna indica]